MKVNKIICIAVIILTLLAGIYFTGIGFETKYHVTKFDTGEYGWQKTEGGYWYNSMFTYDTFEEAEKMAKLHAKDSGCEMKLSKCQIDDN